MSGVLARLPKSDGKVDLRPKWSKNSEPAYRKSIWPAAKCEARRLAAKA
jgi:hypothetical protein